MRFLALLTMVMLATAPALVPAAAARGVRGPYVSLGLGTSIAESVNYNYEYWSSPANTGPPYSQNGTYVTRPAYAGLAALGYGFGNGVRVELGLDFLRNTFHKDDDTGTYPGQTRIYGGRNTYGPMVNLLYDIKVDTGWPVVPYVGTGIGYQWATLVPRVNDTADDLNVDWGTAGSFAYDVILGVSHRLAFSRRVSVTVEYRFMQLLESRDYVTYFGTKNETPLRLGQLSSNTFLVGLRYELLPVVVATARAAAPEEAAAPVAAAVPAPAPVRTYLVFFDWDKAELTARAREIISEAAKGSVVTRVTRLNVHGYTDTSGAPGYNMKLSLRRANSVAAELVADGVPKDEIVIKGFGETHLLVPTGPNVREPQNRRVEIILH